MPQKPGGPRFLRSRPHNVNGRKRAVPAQSVAARLDQSLVNRLEEEAEKRGVTISDVIRARLEESFAAPPGVSKEQLARLEVEIRQTRLAVARGFEALFRALDNPKGFSLEDSLQFVRTKLREGL